VLPKRSAQYSTVLSKSDWCFVAPLSRQLSTNFVESF